MMQIKSLVYLTTAIAIAFAATTQNVLNDINTLKTRLTTLNNDLNSFSGGIAGGLGIHTDATNVQSATDDTTTDVRAVPTPVSEADAQSIINAINGIVPLIESSLNELVAKKPQFQAIPLVGVSLVRSDLSNLATSTSNLESAFIASTPADLLSQANAIKAKIDAAFRAAAAAYA